MIELIVKKFIDDNLDYSVYMEKPGSITEPCFVIEKLGGSQDEHIDTATIAVQTYAPSMYLAASTSETMINAMLNDFIALPEIAKVELNSSYNFPDTTTKHYRYQAIFEIYYYGGIE